MPPRNRETARALARPSTKISFHEVEEQSLVVLSIPAEPGTKATAELTPAEREVASQLCSTLSVQEIAAARGVSVRTVENQIASIYRKISQAAKCHIGSRSDLIVHMCGRTQGPT